MALTYLQSGVNIEEGEQFVRRIKGSVRTTFRKEVLRDLGAFGAFFDARFKGYRSPVLVSSVDGVGTKLLIAQALGKHGSVGEDLVNHCVNDILVCGARPLFFLDYFATGKLSGKVAAEVIEGFIRGCKANGCSLVGGETAEMPGMYKDDDYDLAGTIVGVVERRMIVDGRKIKRGDVLIGLPSTGLHTNGYSLARAVLLNRFDLASYREELGSTLGDALLAVHRSYLKPILPLLTQPSLHGLAHITGGGIEGNTARVIPRGLKLSVDWDAWERPPIFRLIQQAGEVPEEDMRRTFNLGIGIVAIASKTGADRMLSGFRRRGEKSVVMGEIR